VLRFVLQTAMVVNKAKMPFLALQQLTKFSALSTNRVDAWGQGLCGITTTMAF
jgi:hypothetical protein